MPPADSPSPLLGIFVHEVETTFPAAEVDKLEAHRSALAATTGHEDHRRARHCAWWAISLAEGKDATHPRWRELKALHEVWKDAWLGLEYGLEDRLGHMTGRPEPHEDVRIEWTVQAAAAARAAAEDEGWDQVPWEALLVELIAMEPSARR